MILSLILLMIPFSSSGIVATEAEQIQAEEKITTNENVYNKLHFYFDNEEHSTIDDVAELTNAVNSLKANSSQLNAKDISNTTNEIEVTVEFDSNFMQTPQYLEFAKARESLKNPEEVLRFRQSLNDYSKKYHSALVNENIKLLSSLEYSSINVIDYSPFVTLNVNPSDLSIESVQTLCNFEKIKNISLSYETVAETQSFLDEALEGVNAYELVTHEFYTGEGLRIGVYESGVCDTAYELLNNIDITKKDSSHTVKDHATMVTSIIASIAPNAKFFVSAIEEKDKGVEWFISKNCDIVNCSYGVFENGINSDGTYSEGIFEYRYDEDAIFDYQIRAHYVTVCVAAGNKQTNNKKDKYNPNGKVTSPGYAYNAITVGGVELNNSNKWEHSENSCYGCTTPKVKPNIVAPSVVTFPSKFETQRGTSLSTPIVTGCIALLLEAKPQHITYPERILAILNSTAETTYGYLALNGNYDEKVGAGIIDLEAMIDNNFYYSTFNSDGEATTDALSRQIQLNQGTEIQVGLAWLVTANTDDEEVYVTNYDLAIINSSGRIIASSRLTLSNVEMLRYTVETTDTYTIVARQFGDINSNNSGDWISLVYNFN
ncbi:MAG: S8 family serine peptidase [Clostridia bacterium]|nr:S8 family serine peptidase [Clostridia bacterium]